MGRSRSVRVESSQFHSSESKSTCENSRRRNSETMMKLAIAMLLMALVASTKSETQTWKIADVMLIVETVPRDGHEDGESSADGLVEWMDKFADGLGFGQNEASESQMGIERVDEQSSTPVLKMGDGRSRKTILDRLNQEGVLNLQSSGTAQSAEGTIERIRIKLANDRYNRLDVPNVIIFATRVEEPAKLRAEQWIKDADVVVAMDTFYDPKDIAVFVNGIMKSGNDANQAARDVLDRMKKCEISMGNKIEWTKCSCESRRENRKVSKEDAPCMRLMDLIRACSTSALEKCPSGDPPSSTSVVIEEPSTTSKPPAVVTATEPKAVPDPPNPNEGKKPAAEKDLPVWLVIVIVVLIALALIVTAVLIGYFAVVKPRRRRRHRERQAKAESLSINASGSMVQSQKSSSVAKSRKDAPTTPRRHQKPIKSKVGKPIKKHRHRHEKTPAPIKAK